MQAVIAEKLKRLVQRGCSRLMETDAKDSGRNGIKGNRGGVEVPEDGSCTYFPVIYHRIRSRLDLFEDSIVLVDLGFRPLLEPQPGTVPDGIQIAFVYGLLFVSDAVHPDDEVHVF